MAVLRPIGLAALLAFVCAAGAAAAPLSRARDAATPGPPSAGSAPLGPGVVRESAGVELVLVPVSVRGSDGLPVSGLSRDDFTVYEAGSRQEIATFDRDPVPVSLVFGIDTSGSMDRYLPFVKAAAVRFVQRVPRVFAVSLQRFDDELVSLCDFTNDRDHLYYEINSLRANGSGTAILDATHTAVVRISRRPGRRAVVLFTDGEETAVPPEERQEAQEAIVREARAAGVAVYYVGYGWVTGPRMLEAIASATGGRYLPAGRERKITEAFDGIARALDAQYTLGYVPRPGRPGEWRPIRVEVARSPVEVATRAGYLVPGAPALRP